MSLLLLIFLCCNQFSPFWFIHSLISMFANVNVLYLWPYFWFLHSDCFSSPIHFHVSVFLMLTIKSSVTYFTYLSFVSGFPVLCFISSLVFNFLLSVYYDFIILLLYTLWMSSSFYHLSICLFLVSLFYLFCFC